MVEKLFGRTALSAFLLLISCHYDDLNERMLPVNGCASLLIDGYTDKFSYLPGESAKLYLQGNLDCAACRLNIYDVNGNLAFSAKSRMTVQEPTRPKPWENGFGLAVTAEIRLPTDLSSDVYLVERIIPFVVRTNDAVDIRIVYPSNTANAYCTSGGKGLYTIEDKPSFVSFQRPIPLQSQAEFGLRWFSSMKNHSVGFVSDMDLDQYENIRQSSILIITGHSEYWTRKARKNFDRFVSDGGHALVLSGNTMWWQVRYSMNCDKMIRYLNPSEDFESEPTLKTINWDQPSLDYSILSSIGADFPHGGFGLKTDSGWDGYKVMLPESPLLEGTGLKKGDLISLPSGEYDGAPIKGFDKNGYPVLDGDALGFYKAEIIGFDRGSRFNQETIATFMVFQRSADSGIVMNGSSYDWCSFNGMGGRSGDVIKKITSNAIDKLLKGEAVFSSK